MIAVTGGYFDGALLEVRTVVFSPVASRLIV